ncbi:nucleoid-associated protein [Nocardioides lacusdianchii]|uniref:nucleoid-associated protein n=1 Tax=Nocardioides lacusdianchii TaxID=2783664 RepID=UPI001CCA7C49|nr:nucleoid-associated protein [Nocardioides lacusdianchii]
MVSSLRIDKLILHGIKKASRQEDVEPDLSQAESELSEAIRAFLQQQVRGSLKYGREIVEEPGLSDLPTQVRAYWAGQETLLECSTLLARNLQRNQPAVSPEGLLMVADATVDNKQRVFVVAKLEHEKGAQAKREENAQGKLIFSMQFLDDLIFTTGSRVYKIGFFPVPDDPAGPLAGLVVDRQAQGHNVARYFRESYLGCAWKERPELVTERFMDTVQKWINSLEEPEKRARYTVDLISELQSPDTGLSISSFASAHLDVADRDPFERAAREVLPSAEIPKDLTLVQSRINNVRMDTASGIVVIAPPEPMRDGTLTVESDQGGKSVITIHDQISGTGGSGPMRKKSS